MIAFGACGPAIPSWAAPPPAVPATPTVVLVPEAVRLPPAVVAAATAGALIGLLACPGRRLGAALRGAAWNAVLGYGLEWLVRR